MSRMRICRKIRRIHKLITIAFSENSSFLIRQPFFSVLQMNDATISEVVFCEAVVHDGIVSVRVYTDIAVP